jgi:FkbM family methyltransferase
MAAKALLGKLLGTTFTASIQPSGARFPITLRIPSSDVPVYREVFELQEYDFPEPIDPKVILDAGANVGIATVYFASRYPDACILAVEPELSNFECLVKQVAPYKNVTPVMCALWSNNDDVLLLDPGRGKWGFETTAGDDAGEHAAGPVGRVPGKTVESLLEEHSLSHLDLLKLDIEGAEADVLKDASQWIGRVKYVIAELHENKRKGCQSAYAAATQAFAKHWKYGGHVYAARD